MTVNIFNDPLSTDSVSSRTGQLCWGGMAEIQPCLLNIITKVKEKKKGRGRKGREGKERKGGRKEKNKETKKETKKIWRGKFCLFVKQTAVSCISLIICEITLFIHVYSLPFGISPRHYSLFNIYSFVYYRLRTFLTALHKLLVC